MRGSNFMPLYQWPRLNGDRGAVMKRTMSGELALFSVYAANGSLSARLTRSRSCWAQYTPASLHQISTQGDIRAHDRAHHTA